MFASELQTTIANKIKSIKNGNSKMYHLRNR